MSKIKRTITISAESDYEIRRLAKLWGVTITKARERCYHYVAATMNDIGPEVYHSNEWPTCARLRLRSNC